MEATLFRLPVFEKTREFFSFKQLIASKNLNLGNFQKRKRNIQPLSA